MFGYDTFLWKKLLVLEAPHTFNYRDNLKEQFRFHSFLYNAGSNGWEGKLWTKVTWMDLPLSGWPRAHSVKIMNQLLDVRQLLVEVLEVGPCLLVFLIFLILLILFHSTSFDNLKAVELNKDPFKPNLWSSSPWIPHCWWLASAGPLDVLISCWPRPERCETCDSERRTCWSRLCISVSAKMGDPTTSIEFKVNISNLRDEVHLGSQLLLCELLV